MMAVESKTWITPEAEAAFERWQRARRWSWELDGADPDEVRDGLQNHLAHKAHTLGRPLDCDDLEAALGEIDLPKSVPPLEHPSQAPSEATGPFSSVGGSASSKADSFSIGCHFWSS